MMPAGDSVSSPFECDRLVVITQGVDDQALVGDLRRRYASWTVSRCDTYLAGIAELCRQPARAVVVGIDSSLQRVDKAIAGVREAAGPKTKVLLCCAPSAEPVARGLLKHGADDYLLWSAPCWPHPPRRWRNWSSSPACCGTWTPRGWSCWSSSPI